MPLKGMKVAVIATDGVEESELTEPVRALRDAGAEVHIISPKPDHIQAFRHFDRSSTIPVDRELDRVEAGSYDAVMLPGGAWNADVIRMHPRLQQFLKSMDQAGKPVAAICHAGWELISAGLVRGRRLTSYHTIQDDIRNAGGEWTDQEVVRDRNWVTSRQPGDLPAFCSEMVHLFETAAVAAH